MADHASKELEEMYSTHAFHARNVQTIVYRSVSDGQFIFFRLGEFDFADGGTGDGRAINIIVWKEELTKFLRGYLALPSLHIGKSFRILRVSSWTIPMYGPLRLLDPKTYGGQGHEDGESPSLITITVEDREERHGTRHYGVPIQYWNQLARVASRHKSPFPLDIYIDGAGKWVSKILTSFEKK